MKFWRHLLKARPRRVENRVAEELTKWSAERGHHWVFLRRPAVGRSGPDIEVPNLYNWVIDVKSRKSVPGTFFKIVNTDREVKWWIRPKISDTGTSWYAVRLDHLDALIKFDWEEAQFKSVMAHGWLEKMRDWAVENPHNGRVGIGMIVMHRPWKPIGSSVVLISQLDWLRLMEIMEEI